jgi:hypothetical protein
MDWHGRVEVSCPPDRLARCEVATLDGLGPGMVESSTLLTRWTGEWRDMRVGGLKSCATGNSVMGKSHTGRISTLASSFLAARWTGLRSSWHYLSAAGMAI